MVGTAYSSMRQKSKVDQIFPELDEKACDQIPNAGKKKKRHYEQMAIVYLQNLVPFSILKHAKFN